MGYEVFPIPKCQEAKPVFSPSFQAYTLMSNAIAKMPARNDKKPTGLFCCSELVFYDISVHSS